MNTPFRVGNTVSDTVEITDRMVQLFGEMSGDMNPMHFDDAYAKTTRFGRRIAHGMISGALISRVLGMKLGSGGIYLSQNLKFLHPVYLGDTVKIEVTVKSMRDTKGIATCDTTVTNQNGVLCTKGEALIMIADNIKASPQT